MTMLTLLAESAIRSLALAATVWMVLKVARVRNPQARITAWTIVLMAAILMPPLMRWSLVAIPAPAVHLPRMLPTVTPAAFAIEPVRAAQPRTPVNWMGVFGSCYLAGSILLLLRLATGVTITWRLWRNAAPVPEEWNISGDVRRTEEIAAPATFGSTILLPLECTDWTPAMRQAVLAHERSHVEHLDFYIQLLAGVHRAVFWFSPLAWWLWKQLAELAEARSDDAVIANFPDRPSYAEILLGFAKKAQHMPLAVAMARPATVARRVDRLLTETALSQVLNRRQKALLTASLLPLIALAAGCSIHARAQNPVQPSAPAPALPPPPGVPTGSTVVEQNRIAFEHDRRPYYIDDPSTVEAARKLFQEQRELGREQAELGELQEHLSEKQSRVSAKTPDLAAELDSLRAQLELLRDQYRSSANRDFQQQDFGDLQARLGDLQARVGDIQNRIGEQQSRIGDTQAGLGQQQAELGARQAKLAEQQARIAQEAAERIRVLVEEALRKGLARPVE